MLTSVPLVPELLLSQDQNRALGHAELLVVGCAVELEPRRHHLREELEEEPGPGHLLVGLAPVPHA